MWFLLKDTDFIKRLFNEKIKLLNEKVLRSLNELNSLPCTSRRPKELEKMIFEENNQFVDRVFNELEMYVKEYSLNKEIQDEFVRFFQSCNLYTNR